MDDALYEEVNALQSADYDFPAFQRLLAELVLKTKHLNRRGIEERYSEALRLFLGPPKRNVGHGGYKDDEEDLGRIAILYKKDQSEEGKQTLGQVIADVARLRVLQKYQLGDKIPKDLSVAEQSAVNASIKRFKDKIKKHGLEHYEEMWQELMQQDGMWLEGYGEDRIFTMSLLSHWLEYNSLHLTFQEK